jgi:translocation and assembly module TamA
MYARLSHRAALICAGVALGAVALMLPGSVEAQQGVRVAIELRGLEARLQTNVRAVVSLYRQEGVELSPERALSLFDRAPAEIRRALEPFGRYSPEVRSELAQVGSEWVASFDVDPGPPTIVRRVDYALTGPGSQDVPFAALGDSLRIKVGDTLRHAPYEAAKAAFFRHSRNYGYFEAQFDTAQILVDRGAATAEIFFHFETGPRYRFGPISVEQDVLDSNHVDGYVLAVEGEPFDASLLRASQVALTTGPWFGRADLELDLQRVEDRAVPVNFVLTPARPQRYEIAAGFGTDTGFRGTLGVRLRRINPRAHNAEAELRISEVELSLGGRYNIPRPFPSTAVYSVFASLGDVSPTWSSTRMISTGLSRSQLRGPIRETASLTWETASYEAAGVEGSSTMVVPHIDWTWFAANDRILVDRGHRLDLKLSGGLDGVLSTATFFAASLSAKVIRSLGARARVITRAEGGHIVTDDLGLLPPTRRLVAGGAASIRGFEYESVGPGDDVDLLTGGKSMLVGALEVDYEFVRSWRLAAFADAGDAVNSFGDFDAEVGVGLGVRWTSPLGLLRFDLASPLTDPDQSFRLHFVFGPDL